MAAANMKPNALGIFVFALIVLGAFAYMLGIPSWFRSEEKINMKKLLAVSIEMAQRGGEKVKFIKNQNKAMHEKVKGETKEGAKEMVTDADMLSHRAMVYGFNKVWPQLRVISEEHDLQPPDLKNIAEPKFDNHDLDSIDDNQNIPISEIAVWIDPLDATQEYTEDLLQYVTTMACVAVRGQPTIGVIHFPFSGETVWGYVGYGHSANLDLDENSPNADKDKKLDYKLIVSRSHAGQVKGVAENALGKNGEIIPAGGAGYKTYQVIKKKADAYVHVTRIKKWDICAGNAIILSVKGRMMTLEGRNIDYSAAGSAINDNGLLATLNTHENYLQSLKQAFDDMKKADKETKKPAS